MDDCNIVAVENQHTISPRLNKQYTTVVNLGTVTVWYDRWKERLSEHADHIKTLGQFISQKNKTKQKPHTHTHPFKLNMSVNHFFSVCNQEIPIRYVWWWEPEEHASFLCVCEVLDPYMIFCLAHFQNLPQLSKVAEFNTVLNTRDKQTSSNVCLLKLKEKQQHIKNAIRSQSMASLSQIPVLNFSVCKKGKQKDATCTLDCNNPKMPLHTKGLYLY